MSFSHIRLETNRAAVATLTLARPGRLNALNVEMLEELRRAVAEVGASDARCLLITGDGGAFSSGADLAVDRLPDDAGEGLEKHLNPLIESLFGLAIPMVAAVNGPCAGAGCSLALSADIVIAGRSAYFLQAFVNIGLIPDAGATWLLPRLAGRARAIEMMMLAERISAEKAADWGLISRVVDDEHLASEAMLVATNLAKGPTVAFGLIRKLIRDSEQLPFSEALAAERIAQREAGRTRDFKAAVGAFLQKHPPRFEGR